MSAVQYSGWLLGRRFDWLTSTIERGGVYLLLGGRLIPIVPFALIGYAAGATRISLSRFSWTTVVGYLPLTAAVAYLGSRAQTLSTNDPVLWIAVAVVVALFLGERLLRHRLARDRRATGTPRGARSDQRNGGASKGDPPAG
ncbi:MAG: TVP38/TMEM64 family protein [Solirubrobacteraceae bacterium]